MLEERIKKAQEKLQGVANQVNQIESQKQQLENQKQELLKEYLRLEGIIRELTLMKDEQCQEECPTTTK